MIQMGPVRITSALTTGIHLVGIVTKPRPVDSANFARTVDREVSTVY